MSSGVQRQGHRDPDSDPDQGHVQAEPVLEQIGVDLSIFGALLGTVLEEERCSGERPPEA